MTPLIHRVTAVRLYFLPVRTRVPLKFGTETLTSVTCARVAMRIVDEAGREADGWGETPLSVQWAWPSSTPYEARHQAMKDFCLRLGRAWMECPPAAHPLVLGHHFLEHVLPALLASFNQERSGQGYAALRSDNRDSSFPLSPSDGERAGVRGEVRGEVGGPAKFAHPSTSDAAPEAPHSSFPISPSDGERVGVRGSNVSDASCTIDPIPRLAALVCASPFDIALHDAFGRLAGLPTYDTYGPDFLSDDLSRFLEPAQDSGVAFNNVWPSNFLVKQPPQRLLAWHLVGGLDPLEPSQLTGAEPQDGYPVALTDWIQRDGLKCLKIKLRGNDSAWDYERVVAVGRIAAASQVEWLSADFNCTVQDVAYVNEILDRLKIEQPVTYHRLLYVEQPFPYDLEAHRLDVHSLSVRKSLFLDESAHDWRMIRLGRELGWTGVALKTCKTQTGAILSACWAKAHGLSIMVQDLTNPMLAQIPHVLLAANVGTIMGVETNAMQFYPDASAPEAAVHPGLYQRRHGCVDLSTIRGSGFGFRLEEIDRAFPTPALELTAS